MNLLDFDYNLPKELIAQYPAQKRDESRLLVLDRDTGRIEHRIFTDIIEYLNPGDLVVLNNTKVLPAKLSGRKESGGKIEILLLNLTNLTRLEYEGLVKPQRGIKLGSRFEFGNGELEAEVTRIENGRVFLRFDCNGDFEQILDRLGEIPLPPYIKRKIDDSDKERYQTVYACKKGAVAAPTAGLHFTKEILEDISRKGVDIEYITLHVDYGTFRPVKSEDITKHKMEKEYFEVQSRVIEKLNNKKGKIIAVGTTSARAIESFYVYVWTAHCAVPTAYSGWTDLFIYPGYEFKAVEGLLTNFHLPRTTLLMLVAAFCGRGILFKAYEEAIKERYRFYSYGDAMLIM